MIRLPEWKPATESEAAVVQLRHDILSGALKPATKLKMRLLKERYGFGASPMREALARLAALGFVQQEGQKGFCVSPVSGDELIDITRSRQLIEAEALRLAMRHRSPAWEDEIVASFHLFEREVTRFYESDDRRLDEYERRHHRFHRSLIAACPLRALKEFCDELYVRAERYRRLTRTYPFTKDVVIAEHRLLMDAVLAADLDSAVEAIQSHISITAEITLRTLEANK